MDMTKRGQAAMEFLMTYGWAILVVLVAIGALAYFGVLSPDRFLPERCTGPAGMDCVDKATINAPTGVVTIAIRNNLGFPITVYDGTAGVTTECGGASCAPTGTDNCPTAALEIDLATNTSTAISGEGYFIKNNQAASIQFDCTAGTNTLTSGRFKGDMSFGYVNNETGVFHKATFGIRGTS